ncbi:MAG TPA: HD domain-containing phosphohydrolase [Polyangiaceae bacterium]|nr:HD domain-containing phosphohydrolase [Polyangiaceae bacterium]
MDPKMRVPVLCVDDEPQVLEGISLNLRRRYDVTTATSGAAGLEALQKTPTIVVVLSDMRMPGMDGAAFLAQARQTAPDAVRMLLTGQADMASAIAAINEGQIFRFLTKPCPPDVLVAAFDAAVEQHRLVTSERVLLEQTLRGSIQMLSDVLSLANPTAFGRATRIKEHAADLARAAGHAAVWPIEVAAIVSQLGCITLPPATVEKLYLGASLSTEEQAAVDRLPALADGLLAKIPRLDEVRACLVHQCRRFDGTGPAANGMSGDKIPFGARVLRIVHDFEALDAQAGKTSFALDTMRGRTGTYDPQLLEQFATLMGSAVQRHEVREIPIRMVQAGMTFADDVRNASGGLLLPRGYEVTEALLDKVRHFAVKGNVRVIVRRLGRAA